eukprot:comp17773_c0_seq1/m.17808 comp17773_c0_seq1/g.17808  ORF comp17773_c0_seq1/g.17808 comp17773_c0_seq1/m.17808 type:complete len:134 (-) comp17773_c0_seq1:583-984(-)
MIKTPSPSQCTYCETTSDTQTRLQVCSRCRTARYCNVDCQKSHWKVHKKVCTEDNTALKKMKGVPVGAKAGNALVNRDEHAAFMGRTSQATDKSSFCHICADTEAVKGIKLTRARDGHVYCNECVAINKMMFP